jgi:hypothetical protein
MYTVTNKSIAEFCTMQRPSCLICPIQISSQVSLDTLAEHFSKPERAHHGIRIGLGFWEERLAQHPRIFAKSRDDFGTIIMIEVQNIINRDLFYVTTRYSGGLPRNFSSLGDHKFLNP